MLKSFLLKQLVKSQLKNVPEDALDKIIAIVEKNPDLFKQIAEEVQDKTKNGLDQTLAMAEVMKAHDAELHKIVGPGL